MERLTLKRKWEEARKDLRNELGYSHIWKRLNLIEDILGDTYDLDRLRELVESDEDGRCVVPPCKPGDMVYKLHLGEVIELEVEWISCWLDGIWTVEAHTDRRHSDWKSFDIAFSSFGKTVFLTREAAEAALAKEGRK